MPTRPTIVPKPGAPAGPDLYGRLAAVPGVKGVEPLQHRFAYIGSDLQDLYGVRPGTITRATALQDTYFTGGTADRLMRTLAARPDDAWLRIYRRDHNLFVEVVDNGRGFDALNTSGAGNGLANMGQRMGQIDGTCQVLSEPGTGCQVVFSAPMPRERRQWWRPFRRKEISSAKVSAL